MTNEEAIEILQEEHDWVQEPCYVINAIKKAIAALRIEPTGEPMTLEQLREMGGKPVWIELLKDRERSCWEVVKFYDEPMILGFTDGKYCDARAYGDLWLAYAYPPAHIDREAWKPCSMCGGKTTLYQHTNTTKLFMNTFGEAATLVTECMACPPYADCCMKGISANSAFKINFCPECGRPLTEEACAELEKRMGVRV